MTQKEVVFRIEFEISRVFILITDLVTHLYHYFIHCYIELGDRE